MFKQTKARSQYRRAMAYFLAVIMAVTLIPAGFLRVNAQESDAASTSGNALESGNAGISLLSSEDELTWVDGSTVDTPVKGTGYYFDMASTKTYAAEGTYGLMTVSAGSKNGLSYHSTTYGLAAKEGQSFTVQVPGNSYIVVSGDNNSAASATITATSSTGEFETATLSTRTTGHCDLAGCKSQGSNAVSFLYVGSAGSVTLTLNGSTAYICAICIIPAADDITLTQYEQKSFSFSINGAKISVTSGLSATEDSTVSVENGALELATPEEAIVWVNLLGGGSGKLTQSMISDVSDNIQATVSAENTISVEYTNTQTAPVSYKIYVKDNSASGTPSANGTPISYNFKDGSVISDLYTGTRKLSGGNSVSSADGLVLLTGNNNIQYNGTTHGIIINNSDTVSVKVAGDAEIKLSLCQYTNANGVWKVSGLAEGGTITPESANAKVSTDGDEITFTYTGDATTLVFTYEGSQGYIHSMSVTNQAKASDVKNPQTLMPEIMTYGAADAMTPSPVGQRLVLAQTGGSLSTVSGAVSSSVTYYGFEATTQKYRLEADVVLNTCGASNYNGIFFGAFDGTNIATVGIRNSTGLRGIYSKSSTDMAGAGGINASITNGQKVHFTAQKTDDGFEITVKPEGGSESSMVFTYKKSGYLLFEKSGIDTPVSYGFIVANATATVTNMKYYDEDGGLLYDQNDCYAAIGTVPVVSSVSAEVADTRDSISVSWSSQVEADGDGRYVVEVSEDNGKTWQAVAEVTEKNCIYNISGKGSYIFRVGGKLGVDGTCDAYVESQLVEVIAALPSPVVTISSTVSSVTLNWDAVDSATTYDVYRYSYDDGEKNAKVIAQVTTNSYKDTNVTAEIPYYYYVIAKSSSNYSNSSETVWTVPTAGHTGEYVYEDEATEIFLTKKSYDTVFTDKAVLEGIVSGSGTIAAYVNGTQTASKAVAQGAAFSFELSLKEGRNDVNLIFTDETGNKTRKTYNFVYLTNYDIVVDASYTGNDGAKVNGIPTYKTVQAAVDSIPSNNTDNKVILVMAGSYKERLVVNTPYVSLIGEDREMTSIHCYPSDTLGANAEAGGDMKLRCATYIQSGATGFSAENISFANDYVYATSDGKSNKSADALRCDAEGAAFVNVKFTSVQDTLYMDKGHQYYYKCRIEGVVDFIYSGDNARAFFNDCDIVFLYESTKTSGYVCAPKTSADAAYGLTFYNCVITGEEGCSGNGYLLARPWGPNAYITWINCYMGKVVYKTLPYGDMSPNTYKNARFFEYGTYGPAYAINSDRRQISPSAAADMVTASYLGWTPDTVIDDLSADHYVGSITTQREPQYVTAAYTSDTYLWTDGDDTGLKAYDMEGYASAYGVSGGGLLKETSSNYYKAGTAEEFLKALLEVKSSGKKSVIELTEDINLGSNEINNYSKYSSIIKAYAAQPITHPTLMNTGVSILTLTNMHDLTIFSSNGSSIKHANITMKYSENIIIRNIKFDELWEWDEDGSGDYDRNDWDYMTIDEGCNGIWIDHCTFYKAYDGVIDVKKPAPTDNVTISWCEFLPGSEDNVFFDVMMNELASNPDKYPYYKHLLDEGMTEEQIYMYAYGQKKTHLFGESDTATNAAGIYVTLANNYYKNSMDRMPRLRYGYAHVYNCIMDAQELLDAKLTITNETLAKKIVSNGASSTCGAQVLLENCYINGIQNALNSGNGSSPSGYINAVNSVYYMNGVKTTLEPKCNSTGDTRVLVTDADAFISALPYSGYTLYAAEKLDTAVKPYTGAGKLNLTVLQWEKTSYNANANTPDTPIVSPDTPDTPIVSPDTPILPPDTTDTPIVSPDTTDYYKAEIGDIPDDIITEEIKEITGCSTAEELITYLKAVITEGTAANSILKNVSSQDTQAIDVSIMISVDNGKTWVKATKDTFPADGIDVIIPYPAGTDQFDYDFVIGHLITEGWNGVKAGTIEYFKPEKTSEGLKIHIMSASPFVIGWKEAEKAIANDDEDDDTSVVQETTVSQQETATNDVTPETVVQETVSQSPLQDDVDGSIETGDASSKKIKILFLAIVLSAMAAGIVLLDEKRIRR